MTFSKYLSITAALTAAVLLSGADKLPDMARAGDPASQLRLAAEFFSGKNRPVNLTLAFYWFRKAANSGSGAGQYNLAICLLNGWGCEKNPAAAAYFLKKSLDSGIVKAAVPYAKMLYHGVEEGEFEELILKKIAPAPEKAIALLRETTAKNNDPEAVLLLAKFLFRDVEKYGRELCELLKTYYRSTSQPDPEALVIYAACLRSGIGNNIPDPAAGAEVLQKAVDQKHPEATAQLAEMYYFGFGVKADRQKALKLYTDAVKYGSTRAMTDLGQLKLAGIDLPHDPAGAFELFTRAAKAGYPPALRKLGDCYTIGIGTPGNAAKAMECYHQAAQHGDLPATFKLGECYRDGKNIPQNLYAAFYFFNQAALAGHPASMREAGKALLNGKGTEKDQSRGLDLLRRAAADGDPEASALLRGEISAF